MPDVPYSYPLKADEIPADGLKLRLEPDTEVCARIARHVDLLGLHGLAAELKIRPEGEGIHVTGRLTGQVRQISVVSLEPFDDAIQEDVDVRFMPQAEEKASASEEDLDPDQDPPDPLVDGVIDLGVLVTEFLSLAIDPYPRRPGEVFESPEVEDAAPASPFAALADLKNKL